VYLKYCWHIALLSGLSVFAQTPQLPAPVVAPPASAVPATTDLPEVVVSTPEPRYVAPTLHDRIGRIWAPVYLNGLGPFRLVLDTGANRSAIIPRVVEALGNKVTKGPDARLRGVTGTAVVPTVKVDTMELGELILAPVILPVVPDVFGGADGVIGSEGLGGKRIVIDFRHDSITVKRSHREPPDFGFVTLPMKLLRDHLLVTEIFIGRVRAKAILDTGAPDSLGNQALLTALKRSAKDEPTSEIVGVTLDIEHGNRVRMPRIQLQSIMISGATVTFSDVYIFRHWGLTNEPAILLGMDVLGVVDKIIIDYLTHELHVRPRGG
jgi:Aspartyl protease